MTESIRVRDALQDGISRGELAGSRWCAVSHGLYAPAEAGSSLADRCRQIQPVLPTGSALSHLTAAALWGVWLPTLPDWLPLQATIPPGSQRPERAGLYVARSRAALPTAVLIRGAHVLAPELVIGQLAEDLSLIDLVVAIDCVLHRRLCTVSSITAALRSRQRGLPMLRRALHLHDGRSESPWETILRLLHVLSGVPVEPQHKVRDHEGQIVARADLRITGTNRLPEYDGAEHRAKQRHQRDLARDKMLARLGLERYGYTSSEVLEHPGQVLRDAEDALGRRHDTSRLEPWLLEFERSSLSPLGWRRLLRRLNRFDRPLRGRGPRRRAPANCGEVQRDTPRGA